MRAADEKLIINELEPYVIIFFLIKFIVVLGDHTNFS